MTLTFTNKFTLLNFVDKKACSLHLYPPIFAHIVIRVNWRHSRIKTTLRLALSVICVISGYKTYDALRLESFAKLAVKKLTSLCAYSHS